MKLTVYAILLLAFMVGLTLVQVEMSNNDTPFQALSETEMQATSGAGDCPTLMECAAPQDTYCGSKDCDPSSRTLTAVKQSAAWYRCCSEEDRNMTHDCVVHHNKFQTCAVRYHYNVPVCLGPPSQKVAVPMFDAEAVEGCPDAMPGGGGGSGSGSWS